MQTLSLNGKWKVANTSGPVPCNADATVPGCVHTDLLDAGLISDPFYRDHEKELQWIGESDWSYSRDFTVDASLLSHNRLMLECEGLDTFATVSINGHCLGRADNMFRSWKWDVKSLLNEGVNRIEVLFESPLAYGMMRQKEHMLKHTGIGHHRLEGGNWVRKQACNYGWDWGPMLLTAGIWENIHIRAWDEARLQHVQIEPVVFADDSANIRLQLEVEMEGNPDNLTCECVLMRGEEQHTCERFTLDHSGQLEAVLSVENVERWWPAGMGKQPLYTLEVAVLKSNTMLDKRVLRVGFRDLALITEFDEWGQSFKFRANGRDFFAKGANWIPADTFNNRTTHERLQRLLQAAVEANMNCLRVWGGGIYESDAFYDICDELGICVWQDFMFACSAYPLHLPEFVENACQEAEENVRRLHHHPSLFLWCGNNELEHMDGYIGDDPGAMRWDHYSHFFDHKLRDIVNRLHPASSYWPASEHSPVGNRTPRTNSSDPRWGDAHLWQVWHFREPFEWYRSSFHRFCSEFGFQSFPHPATIASVTDPSDRSVTSHVMEHHQRSESGNQLILAYMLDWFRLPMGFKNTLWLSQILQLLGIKYAVEHWRRNMPRCMGATYWQLNDCWPVASWASIDSHLRWKALHYGAKRFFAPELVTVIEDEASGSLTLFVTRDNPDETEGEVRVKTWHARTGKLLDAQTFTTTLPGNGAKEIACCHPSIAKEPAISRHDLIFQVELLERGRLVSDNMATWVRPKHLHLVDPLLTATVTSRNDGTVEVVVKAQTPALWVWLDVEGHPDLRWNDNFFHLFPDSPHTVQLMDSEGVDIEVLKASLRVRSLWDTFQE